MVDEKIKDILDIVDEELEFLHIRLNKNQITEDQFHKAEVELVYKLALAGYVEDAADLYAEIKLEYFDTAAIKHMEDADFFRKCALIYEVFAFSGMTPYNAMYTLPEGKA